MDDIWIISWFNHTAFDANPIWKSPKDGDEIRLLFSADTFSASLTKAKDALEDLRALLAAVKDASNAFGGTVREAQYHNTLGKTEFFWIFGFIF